MLVFSSIYGGISWTQTQTQSGFGITKQGPDDVTSTINPPINTINELFAEIKTIAASASYTWDLQNLTNLLNVPVVFNKVRGLHLHAQGSTAVLSPGASDPATWFMGGTTPTITLPDGSQMTLGWNTNYTISNSQKTLTVTNSGSTSLTLTIAIIGGV